MTERPILFSTPMVKAILDGRKTMTRRAMKPQPQALIELNGGFHPTDDNGDFMPQSKHYADGKHFLRCVAKDFCPYGQPGDHLWVRETWCNVPLKPDGKMGAIYKADGPDECDLEIEDGWEFMGQWRPSIFMPRWASRITLEITNVRVERLNSISREDAIKEGLIHKKGVIEPDWWENGKSEGTYLSPVTCFEALWDSINGKTYPWSSNPFVWVIEFKRLEAA